ncbi:zinc finger domain-containing protein, partial [Euroglyphus maynei]
MADIVNKINFLESENKLLMDQQQNYKELCKILTQRHVEILKYLSHLRNLVEKIMSLSKENVLYANYHTDKSSYEANILKYDKQIQFLTESIQSSHTRISDNEGNSFKEHLKLLSSSLVDPSSPKTITIQQLESNIQNQQQQQHQQQQQQPHTVLVYHTGDFTNAQEIISHEYFKKEISNEVKMNEDGIFVPKLVLEDLEYNNNNANTTYPIMANNNTVAIITTAAAATTNNNDNNMKNDSANIYKKLAICEYCGKYFNKHYLASHKRSHTGARPYKCSIQGCNRTFTQTSSRNVHEKRVHNVQHGKLEFKCTYCDAGFDNLSDMQKHAQQHQALINTVVTQQSFDHQIPVTTITNIKNNNNN